MHQNFLHEILQRESSWYNQKLCCLFPTSHFLVFPITSFYFWISRMEGNTHLQRKYLISGYFQMRCHSLHLGRHSKTAAQHSLHQIIEAIPSLFF